MAMLVDGAPEVVQLASDADEHLVHEPLVAWRQMVPLQRVREKPSEAQAPLTDALVADHHATGSQDQLDIAQAEAKAMVELDRVPAHLGWVAVAATG